MLPGAYATQDSAEYIIPMPTLNSFLEVVTGQLQATLPTLLPPWIEEVVALAVSRFKPKSKILDSASLVNECSSSTSLLHQNPVSDREFTTFKGRVSINPSGDPGDSQVHIDNGRAYNPFATISRLIWNLLRRMRWLLSPKPTEFHIPNEHARAVYMRALGEPWLLNVERAVLTSLTLAFGQMGLFEGFDIRYSIAVALAALPDL